MVYKLLNQYTVPAPQPSVEPTPGVQYIGTGGQVSWSELNDTVQQYKDACQPGESVKVIYLQRHGHGEHNPMPENPMPHWSRFKGLCQPNIIDPALSKIGEEQMSHLSLKLKSEQDLPLPSKVYTSITKRTCQSSIEVWRALLPQVPIIAQQDLRDTLEGRGFSKRGPLSDIKRLFPGITILVETTENDDLWLELGGKETLEHLKERVDGVFDKIWDMAVDDDCIAIVAHKDIVDTLYTSLFGMEEPDFQTAEMRVVVVKRII